MTVNRKKILLAGASNLILLLLGVCSLKAQDTTLYSPLGWSGYTYFSDSDTIISNAYNLLHNRKYLLTNKSKRTFLKICFKADTAIVYSYLMRFTPKHSSDYSECIIVKYHPLIEKEDKYIISTQKEDTAKHKEIRIRDGKIERNYYNPHYLSNYHPWLGESQPFSVYHNNGNVLFLVFDDIIAVLISNRVLPDFPKNKEKIESEIRNLQEAYSNKVKK